VAILRVVRHRCDQALVTRDLCLLKRGLHGGNPAGRLRLGLASFCREMAEFGSYLEPTT
jgi:hypothetical protein